MPECNGRAERLSRTHASSLADDSESDDEICQRGARRAGCDDDQSKKWLVDLTANRILFTKSGIVWFWPTVDYCVVDCRKNRVDA